MGEKKKQEGEGHPHGDNIWMKKDPLMLENIKRVREPDDNIKSVREPHYNWKMPETIKRVRRNTCSDIQNPGQDPSKQIKKQRHFSAGSTGEKTEEAPGDLLGSIFSGMEDVSNQKVEWEGQPALSRKLQKKFDKIHDSPTSIKSPPDIKPSQSFGLNFKQKRIGNRHSLLERKQLQSKARSWQVDQAKDLAKVTLNGTTSVVQNTGGKITKKENKPRIDKNDKDKKSDSKNDKDSKNAALTNKQAKGKKPNEQEKVPKVNDEKSDSKNVALTNKQTDGQEKTSKKVLKVNDEKSNSMKKEKPNLISHWVKNDNTKEASANEKQKYDNSKKFPMEIKKKYETRVIKFMTPEEDFNNWLEKMKNKEAIADKKDEDEQSTSKKKLPVEMKKDTKGWRPKSSWKGSRKLGSMRESYRSDRAYDFGRNHMEINDSATPNDEFQRFRFHSS